MAHGLARLRSGPWLQARAFLGWLALTLLFYVPASRVMDASLDGSNLASYSYFVANGFQYGPQVVPMVGPYGFVTYGYIYAGHLFWTRAILEFALKGVLAALVAWFLRSARGRAPVRWAWLGAMLVFAAPMDDAPAEWITLLTGLWLISRPRGARPGANWAVIACGAPLALVALLKGSQTALVLATLGLVSLYYVLLRRFMATAVLWAGFLLGLLLLWLLAGQELANLPLFLRGVYELASGFNEAMGLEEHSHRLGRGLAAALSLATALGWAAFTCRRSPRILAGLLLFAGFGFVKWKHGFVRADMHVIQFFHFVILGGLAWWPFLTAAQDEGDPPRRSTWPAAGLLTMACFGAGLYGASEGTVEGFTSTFARQPAAISERITRLLTLPEVKASLESDLAARRDAHRLPRTKETVGQGTIDFFGVEHGVIPLNQLRYAPRPVSGGAFNVYSPYLMRRNQEHLRDPTNAPEFFLVKIQTIDDRLATQDDALTLMEILQRYVPLSVERGYVLARRRPGAATVEAVKIGERHFRFGERVDVPHPPAGRLLLASFEVASGLGGRLRALVYKPPGISIELGGVGIDQPCRRRFVPSMASVPILFSPLVENNDDYLRLCSRMPGKMPAAFTLATRRPGCFEPELAVTFYSVPAPPPSSPLGED